MTRRGKTGNHEGDRMGDPIIRGNTLRDGPNANE